MTTIWKRKDLKTKGKAAFQANYWKCLVCALILAIITGGVSSGFTGGLQFRAPDRNHEVVEVENLNDLLDLDAEDISEQVSEKIDPAVGAGIAVFSIVAVVIGTVVLAIGIAVDAFLVNPIELGCKRFFRRNLDEPASLSNITYAFDASYMNIVKTMILRDIFTALWSMLFFIPGIIKAYEYRMIPYLLSEDPTMSYQEAFAQSKALMTGNKWKAFVLDLSFILWDIGSIFTCGLLGIFYVEPYKASTSAALYETLKYGTNS